MDHLFEFPHIGAKVKRVVADDAPTQVPMGRQSPAERRNPDRGQHKVRVQQKRRQQQKTAADDLRCPSCGSTNVAPDWNEPPSRTAVCGDCGWHGSLAEADTLPTLEVDSSKTAAPEYVLWIGHKGMWKVESRNGDEVTISGPYSWDTGVNSFGDAYVKGYKLWEDPREIGEAGGTFTVLSTQIRRQGSKTAAGRQVSPNELNNVVEFDSPFQVHEDGTVTDYLPSVYAPEVYEELDDDGQAMGDPHISGGGWEFVTGYSGQYGYSGPVMHSSEFLGGQMARDVLDDPGVYVVTVVTGLGGPEEDDDAIGWALLKKSGAKTAAMDEYLSDVLHIYFNLTGQHLQADGHQIETVRYGQEKGMEASEVAFTLAKDKYPGRYSIMDLLLASDKASQRHAAAEKRHWIDTARHVLEHGIYGDNGKMVKHDGVLIDAFTASMLTQVHDALSGENQAKFRDLPLDKAVTVGWKLTKPKTSAATDKRYASPQAWRRLRAALSEGEALDIARDIAGHIAANPHGGGAGTTAGVIEHALTQVDWDERSQA